MTSDVNSPCIFEEVTREFLRGSRANSWENMAEDALRKEWEVFGFERLNKHQEEALQIVVESKSDVFVNLPTGFGESVVFQALSIQGHLTTVFCKISTSTLLIDNAFASSQYKLNKLQYKKYNNRIKMK